MSGRRAFCRSPSPCRALLPVYGEKNAACCIAPLLQRRRLAKARMKARLSPLTGERLSCWSIGFPWVSVADDCNDERVVTYGDELCHERRAPDRRPADQGGDPVAAEAADDLIAYEKEPPNRPPSPRPYAAMPRGVDQTFNLLNNKSKFRWLVRSRLCERNEP